MLAEIGGWIIGLWAKLRGAGGAKGPGQTTIGIGNVPSNAVASGDNPVAVAGRGHTVNIHPPGSPKEECISVRIGINNKPSLFVDIFNSGEIDVYIKEVVLFASTSAGETLQSVFFPAERTVVTGDGGLEYI